MIANFSNKKIITYVGWTNNLKKEYPMRETVKVSKIFLLIEKFQKLDRSLIYMILALGLISVLCLYSIDKGLFPKAFCKIVPVFTS